MPNFTYKAVNHANRIVTGTIMAITSAEVSADLKKQDLQPITIREEVTFKASQSNIPVLEKMTFCRYVSTMLYSGLSLSEGIAVLRDETKQPVMKQVLNDMLYHLERGDPMSQSLALYPKAFDSFFITLVKAGEVSGTMAASFKYLEVWLRADYSVSQKIKGALIYPSVVLTAMFGIGGLMMFFVMPQIGKVFLHMTIPIPPMTRAIFQFSMTMSLYRIPIIASLVVLIISGYLFFSQATGKKLLLKMIKPVPIINNLMLQLDIARFCRIFSTLIASAVSVTDAMEIALNSLTDPKYKSMSKAVVANVMQGKTIAQSFREYKAFPPLLIQMIAGGEKSGTLDKTLADLAAFYEDEVTDSVKKSTDLLEPLLMLVVGIGVGGLILSIIAPMYSVVGSLSPK